MQTSNFRFENCMISSLVMVKKILFRPRGARIQIGVDQSARKQTPRRLIYYLTPTNSPKRSKKCEKASPAGIEPGSHGPKPSVQTNWARLLSAGRGMCKIERNTARPRWSFKRSRESESCAGMTDRRTDGRTEKKTTKNAENGCRNLTTKNTILLRVLALFGTDQPPRTCRISIFALGQVCVGYFLKTPHRLQSY